MIVQHYPGKGFTLAELLIALVILGVIATFTIPKVLVAQQDQKYDAIAKETAAMISGAYQVYQQNNTVTSTTSFQDMTPYMNYVRLFTTGKVDGDPVNGTGGMPCDSTSPCLQLHNGAVVNLSDYKFGGTNATNG